MLIKVIEKPEWLTDDKKPVSTIVRGHMTGPLGNIDWVYV